MNQAMLCETDHSVHELIVDRFGVDDLSNLNHRKAVHQFHDDTVTIAVDRLGYTESMFVQRSQKCILLLCGQTRHIQPRGTLAMLHVVTLGLDRTETHTAQTMELESVDAFIFGILGIGPGTNKDIRLFTNANLVSDASDHTSSTKCTKRQKVISKIGETIAIVLLAFVIDQLQLVTVRDGTLDAASLETSDGHDELSGNQVVVLHTHLDGGQNAERIS
mmetsp:Transcript_37456/g.94108  ORF Transcript_37456/g.94108 Transcript_37456/m.94108 type:complete len:219 (+) Transcript_37456:1140-1796(+)